MIRLATIASLFLFIVAVSIGPLVAAGNSPANSDAAILADLFAGRSVLHIEIQIPHEGMRNLSGGWQGGPKRPSAMAVVKEGNQVFTNVSIHIKGGVGSNRPINDDPAFTLNFEKYAPGQTFHGLKKLSLNNSVQDPTFLNDKICRELFNAAGSPTPRAGFTTVRLNGRDLGIHVLTEGFNKQFLRNYFTNVHGNLYQTHGNQEITDQLEVNSGDDPKNDSGLRALAEAVSEQDSAARWRRLGQTLDIDRFVSFMAMEIICCHWDGYCMNQNNYRVFHDLGANKIVFIAHGTDQMFGTGTMLLAGGKSSPECPIFPQWHGAVADAVMSTTEGRRLYLSRLGQLYTNLFRVETVLKRVDELSTVVQNELAQAGSSTLRNYQRKVDGLKANIAARDKSLARQLAMATQPRDPKRLSPIHLSGWKPRVQDRQVKFELAMLESRRNLLHISATQGHGTGSWRTELQLDPGRYRFEGEIKVQGVTVPNSEGGAVLRISGARPRHGLSGTADWQPFGYEFQVGNSSQVEFVCELKALQGEAWFDGDKLQVVPLE